MARVSLKEIRAFLFSAPETAAANLDIAKAVGGAWLEVVDLKWRILHARGYLELGMFKESKAELDAIPAAQAPIPEVVALRVGLLQTAGRWRELLKFAHELVKQQPDEAGWWILWAFAARRASSLEKAEKILLTAEARHPKEATIQFNLGCYASQLGNLPAAKTRVIRAIALDNAFLKHALEDPDLQPLRDAQPDWINAAGDESAPQG